MRNLDYLSPTGISKAQGDFQEFYKVYLSENRQPREPQTKPMSIGSAFDAFVKSFLYEKLIGKGDARFELQTLFEDQVEPHNRDWAHRNGKHCFKLYRESGALAELLIELNQAVSEPVFEVSLQGLVKDKPTSPGAVLLGKPDIYYIGPDGIPIIIDWKVNGWCSNSPVSPKRGHLGLRHGSSDRSKDKPQHRDAHIMKVAGMFINFMCPLDKADDKWARQLTIYAWLCGAPVGSEFIVGIDQVCCKPVNQTYPEVRFAKHRSRVSEEAQRRYYAEAEELWEIVHSDHIFRDMTFEQSKTRCETLDSFDHSDDLFNEMSKSSKGWF